jgi:hypothetical protein
MSRPEFLQKYPNTLKSQQFVDALLLAVSHDSAVDLSSERPNLVALDDGTIAGRAAIINSIAANPSFVKTQATRAFVLLSYFGYLRREPDDGAFNFWLNILNAEVANNTAAYPALVCAFINSAEYQSRFGMLTTHTDKECKTGLGR